MKKKKSKVKKNRSKLKRKQSLKQSYQKTSIDKPSEIILENKSLADVAKERLGFVLSKDRI